MLLNRDNDILRQSEVDLSIYQRSYNYAKTYLCISQQRGNMLGMIEIRFVQDLGLAKPGFLPNGMKYKDVTIPIITGKYVGVLPTVNNMNDIAQDFADRVLVKARETKAIDIIIGYHYR